MSNYTDKEYSVDLGSPVEVFKFIGTHQNYLYTSADEDVTVNAETYEAIGITRNAVKLGTQEEGALQLEIEMPYDTPLAVAYAFAFSPPDLTLELRRVHKGTNFATDSVLYWKGPATSFTVKNKKCKVLVPSTFQVALNAEVPNKHYQQQCNHQLYDARCKVVDTAYKTTTTITDVTNDTTIEVADDGFADGYLVAGEIINTTANERRLIVSNVANVLTINFPFINAQDGDSVTLRAGCAHNLSECDTKFSNSVNYGGFPFLPSLNPFDGQF